MAKVEMTYLNSSGTYETIYPKVDLSNITGTLPVANGGTGTTSLNSLMTNMGAARIQTGSYVGTGTYGASNPCSLTFNFIPQFIFVSYPDIIDLFDSNTSAWRLHPLIAIRGVLSFSVKNDIQFYMNWTNNIFKWYTEFTQAGWQLNEVGTSYFYLAIG